MAEVVLFHHAQGLSPGVVAFADELRRAGHIVHTPDLFDGQTFGSIEEGMGYAEQIGFPREVIARGLRAVEALPAELVYAGFSLGVVPAQMLAQTRPGTRGALLFHAALPLSEFGGSWPQGAPLQIHFMEDDPWAEEDLPAAREIVDTIDRAELFLYPGNRHLFADNSVSDYDEGAATLLEQRVLSFLRDLDQPR